ncbi:MAG TPA: hypothetical protein VFG50_08120, partial [Rhodothermales bacterium]|nr:hypothetical protein [Rhodothermales bacterium]
MPIDLRYSDRFADRHIGPSDDEIHEMLEALGVSSLDELTNQTIPAPIRVEHPLDLPPARSEAELLDLVREIGSRNTLYRSYIGMGYHDT